MRKREEVRPREGRQGNWKREFLWKEEKKKKERREEKMGEKKEGKKKR